MGSSWYFPAALRLDEQNTLLLLSASMDRSATSQCAIVRWLICVVYVSCTYVQSLSGVAHYHARQISWIFFEV